MTLQNATKIFPDEIDNNFEEVWTGITTRTGNGRRLTVLLHQEKNGKTSNEYQPSSPYNNALLEWKRKSKFFRTCTKPVCDPFGQFSKTGGKAICKDCSFIRNELRQKTIVVFDANKLSQLLVDYIYFHAIKVFSKHADQHYTSKKSRHPYFTAYTLIKKGNKLILRNLASAFGFSTKLQHSSHRAFMSLKNSKSMQDVDVLGLESNCQLCLHLKNQYNGKVDQMIIAILSGSRYSSNNFELIQKENIAQPDHFIFCQLHARVFKIFYHLTHMDWNVHWNCYYRLSQAQEYKDATDTINGAELIDAINPDAISDIAKSYYSFYRVIDLLEAKYISYSKSNNIDIVGLYNWFQIRKQLKDASIFHRLTQCKNLT